jgi:type 1 fimbria pilin
MKLFAQVAAIAIFISGALNAQEIAVRWIGVADTTDEGGTKRQESQTVEIRNEDGKLTGSTIGKTGKAGTPFKVEQDGARFNFYAYLDFEGGEHLRWKLELKDGKLVGTFSAMHDDPKKWVYDRIGAITMTKAPVPR